MGNQPYLFIGALDLSPYIVSVNSPSIALRGLSAELEQEIYAILNFGKRYNSIGHFGGIQDFVAVASCIGCGWLTSGTYADQGKLGITLSNQGNNTSYFIWLKNLDNKWWTRTNSRREAWRKEKQAKLL